MPTDSSPSPAKRLLPPKARVVVGVSGGVDSLVLLHMLKKLGYKPVAAHVNYGLRGDEADADEAHVKALCKKWRIAFRSAHLDAQAEAEAQGTSLQEAARTLRYAFFGEVAAKEKAAYVAVAHHRNDQAETLLLNLFRGTGLDGMAGMRPRRPLAPGSDVMLVRPLLPLTRAEILAYARAEGIAWREDASNAETKYARNAIRNEILPRIAVHFGVGVVEHLARATDMVRDYLDTTMYTELAARFGAAAIEEAETEGGSLRLDVLAAEPGVWRGRLILEALRRWLPGAPLRYDVTQAVEALLASQPGRHVTLDAGQVWRERERLVFAPTVRHEAAGEEQPLALGETLVLPQGRLSIEEVERPPVRLDAGTPSIIYVDADALDFPLTVRRWRRGDRFQPFGLNGTKNVSDLLTDLKVPSRTRKEALVLVSGGEIIWVMPYRMADPIRIRPETQRFAKITFD